MVENISPVQPLSGIRVVDFSRIIAGPCCAQYLADFGAEVIKIERKQGGDDARDYVFPATWNGTGAMYLAFNRGKKSIALDLSDEDDLAKALALVASADVLIENFRPGVMSRLSLDYEKLSPKHPGLIYCSISGFGSSGPLAQSGANDLVAQAACGLMSLNATGGDRPQKVVPAMVDLFTGVNAALAIVAAFNRRSLNGLGVNITTSLYECGISLLSYFATSHFATSDEKPPGTEADDSGASITVPNQSFRTSDGWLVVACSNEPMWSRFCVAIGSPELRDDPRFRTNLDRTRNKAALIEILERRLGEAPRHVWMRKLEEAKVSGSSVCTVDEVLSHPQTDHLGMVQSVHNPSIEGFRALRAPFRFDGQSVFSSLYPPSLGQNEEEILRDAV